MYWIREFYECIRAIPATFLINDFFLHFNHVSLATVQLNCLSSGTKEHGQNEGKIGNEESGGNRSDAFIELTNSIHLFIAQLVVEIWGRNGGNQVRRRTISELVWFEWNKLQCYIISPCNLAYCINCQLWDPFIAKREMPGTKGWGGEHPNLLYFSMLQVPPGRHIHYL